MNLLTQLPLYILEFATTENHNKCEIFMVQYSPKIMHCSDSQELLFASASWQLCVANLQGACAWILQDARTSFAVRNLNHKKLFVVGFSNSNNFFVVKSIPAEMVQRSLQNEGAYFYRAKLNRSFFHSVSRFCFHFTENFVALMISLQPTVWSWRCYAEMQKHKWVSGISMRKRVH